jgi:hypothetical protein
LLLCFVNFTCHKNAKFEKGTYENFGVFSTGIAFAIDQENGQDFIQPRKVAAGNIKYASGAPYPKKSIQCQIAPPVATALKITRRLGTNDVP